MIVSAARFRRCCALLLICGAVVLLNVGCRSTSSTRGPSGMSSKSGPSSKDSSSSEFVRLGTEEAADAERFFAQPRPE